MSAAAARSPQALIGNPDKFPSIYAKLVSDPAIKKPDALQIAQELLGKIPRSTTKRAAFEKIGRRILRR